MAINFPSTTGQATDGSFTHTASGITWAWDGTTWLAQGVTGTYTLPTASATALGGIKVGTGLSINSTTSVLSATASAITVQEEGTSLATAATTLNFVGTNVTAAGTGATKTITITAPSSAAPEITWTLNASGPNHYEFTGPGLNGTVNDPTLYLIRGQTYKFFNNTSGTAHPFQIQSVAGVGGAAYNTGVTNNGGTNGVTIEFEVPLDAPNTLYYQCTAHANMVGTIHVLTQGQLGLDTRSTFTATTASLANNAAGNIEVTAHKSYSLLKIKPSIAAWVTLYVDAASRTADANRVQGADPAPDAGVIAEVVTTTANEEIKMSPGVIGWHQDAGNDGVDTVFCKVVNKSGSTGTCTVALTVVQLEA